MKRNKFNCSICQLILCLVNTEDSRTKSELNLDLVFNANLDRFTLNIQSRFKTLTLII